MIGNRFTTIFVAVCMGILLLSVNAFAVITADEFKSKVQQATKDFHDISMMGTVTYKNKEALTKVDSNYSRIYEFKTANVMFAAPDKLHIEGKLGMVKFEYIVNGGTKIFRAPAVKLNKKEDYSKDPAKLQNAMDIGLVTPGLWKSRSIEIVDDPEAAANGEIKLRLHWQKGDMVYYAWVDAQNFWLKKFEKWDSQSVMRVRMVYSNPVKAGDLIWMPQKVEMFTADGTKAGALEFTDIKVNSRLQDSLFE